MKTTFLFAVLLSSFTVSAQYYYNDIIGTLETNNQVQAYRINKVRMVSATGYTPQGSKAADFAEVQEVKENGRLLRMSSNVNMNYTVYYNRFDEQGRLVSITDSSAGLQSVTTYQYDAAGKIIKVENKTTDAATDFSQTETHQWIYSSGGQPEKMWRTLNGADSIEVRFIPDENGNPGEEISYKNGYETDHIYYYFDEKNRLTDIVRYNKRVKRLMPDIIITYDDADRAIQKVISNEGDNYGLGRYGNVLWIRYVIWRYIYNEQGLKTKEALFNKDQELTGKIEYTYTFGQ